MGGAGDGGEIHAHSDDVAGADLGEAIPGDDGAADDCGDVVHAISEALWYIGQPGPGRGVGLIRVQRSGRQQCEGHRRDLLPRCQRLAPNGDLNVGVGLQIAASNGDLSTQSHSEESVAGFDAVRLGAPETSPLCGSVPQGEGHLVGSIGDWIPGLVQEMALIGECGGRRSLS